MPFNYDSVKNSMGCGIDTAHYFRKDGTWQVPPSAGGGISWGDIIGNLPDQSDLQTSLNGKQALITTGTISQYFRGDLSLATFPTTTAPFSNSTDKNFVTDAKLTVVNNTSGTNTGDQANVSGNAGTATILQTSRSIDGQLFNGSSDIYTENELLAYLALGSPILAQTVGQKLFYSNVSTALVDGQIKYTGVYLPKAAILTGIKVYVRVLGAYTGDNNNRVGLYTYSGGTLTLVASSTNSASLWTSAANAIQTIPFSSTYAAVAGIYFVGFIYNNSVQTTAPALASGIALNNLAMAGVALGFTNSAKLYGTSSATDLPASIASSSITASVIPSWVAIY